MSAGTEQKSQSRPAISFARRLRGVLPFASLFLALMGIVLSQLPPVRTWFGRPHLSIQVSPTVRLFNNLGDLEIYAGVRIFNSGFKNGKIDKMGIILCHGRQSCNISYSLEKIAKLGESFLPTASYVSLGDLPFEIAELDYGASYSDLVRFSALNEPSRQKELSGLRLDLENFAREVFPAYPARPSARLNGDQEEKRRKSHEARLNSILERSIQLAPLPVGDYELVAYLCSGTAKIAQSYEFSVFDHDVTSYSNGIQSVFFPGGKPPLGRPEIELPIRPATEPSQMALSKISCNAFGDT